MMSDGAKTTPTAEERAMKAFSLGMTVASPDDAREFIAKEIRAAVEAERESVRVGWKTWFQYQRETLAETTWSDEKKRGYLMALENVEFVVLARSEGTG